jgi:hypothetical protein
MRGGQIVCPFVFVGACVYARPCRDWQGTERELGGAMNLRSYYQKVRELSESLEPGDVWVESLATPDGGKAGVFTQVSRQLAAKLVVDGRARLANVEAAEEAEQRRKAMQGPGTGVERMVVTLEGDAEKTKKLKG